MKIPRFRSASVGTSILHAQRRRHTLGWILLTAAVTAACNGSGNDAIEPEAEATTTTTRQNATTTVPPITTTVVITTAQTATTSTTTTTTPSTTTAATTTTLAPTTTAVPTTTIPATTTTTTPAPPDALQITIANFAFSGDSSGSVGDTVTVRNNDSVAHTWTAVGGAFHSGNLGGGGTFTYTFESAGTFDYICQIHPSMTGSITISG